MDQAETDALLAITLMAAFCDGQKQSEERAHIKEIFDSLGVDSAPAVYREVVLKQVGLEDVVKKLTSRETRQFAYELAVGVCDADEVLNSQEKAFLNDLRKALGLTSQASIRIEQDAAAITQSVPLDPEATPSVPPVDAAKEAEAEKTILRYAIFAAALELLPQTLATLAIVPVQVRLVYVIGSTYGFTLDTGHIKEFIGAIGVGLTAQYVEGAARKLLGGLVSRFAGGFGGTVARTATGSAITFATTYAIGKVAHSYYGGGRRLDLDTMKRMFANLSGQASGLYSQYEQTIAEQAQGIDMSKLSSLIQRGM